eukprot:4205514-Prymnesium_polylepis.1
MSSAETTTPRPGAGIQVIVRVRPPNAKEKNEGTLPIVTTSTERKEVCVIRGAGQKAARNTFKFDQVFGSFSTQQEVFSSAVLPIIGDVLNGYESTLFAYGQTGTGKTHTIEGSIDVPEEMGIIPRATEHIFTALQGESFVESTCTVSYLEIYNEELRDLLSPSDVAGATAPAGRLRRPRGRDPAGGDGRGAVASSNRSTAVRARRREAHRGRRHQGRREGRALRGAAREQGEDAGGRAAHPAGGAGPAEDWRDEDEQGV